MEGRDGWGEGSVDDLSDRIVAEYKVSNAVYDVKVSLDEKLLIVGNDS